eukprot:5929090-Alexandrium_andersonii.AAC.1
MPSKREITASGLSSACEGPWLSGARSLCPVAASVSAGVSASWPATAIESLLRAALAEDSALFG